MDPRLEHVIVIALERLVAIVIGLGLGVLVQALCVHKDLEVRAIADPPLSVCHVDDRGDHYEDDQRDDQPDIPLQDA